MADGTIYVGAGTIDGEDIGNFYAFNPDGSQKWNFPTGLGFESSPAIGTDGTIYLASGDCTFYALNPDGTQKWNFTLTTLACDGVTTPAIGTDGTIYVGYTAPGPGPSGGFPLGVLLSVYYALRPNGTQKWQTDVHVLGPVGSAASPAIGADGTIYVGTHRTDFLVGNLFAVNPDGMQVGTASDFPFLASPAIAPDGTIYDGTSSERGGG